MFFFILQMYKIKNTRLFSESRISIYTKYFIVPIELIFSNVLPSHHKKNFILLNHEAWH